MERDPETGRFLAGNKAAIGNKGNRNPKWGNKNAVKHGLFSSGPFAKVHKDGNLYIFTSRKRCIRIEPDGFFEDDEGRIRIRNDVARELEKYHVRLK